MAVATDHVHMFLDFPPRYSIAKVVGLVKSISANRAFAEFPELKKPLWSGELEAEGYFARTVGDKVTAEVILMPLTLEFSSISARAPAAPHSSSEGKPTLQEE